MTEAKSALSSQEREPSTDLGVGCLCPPLGLHRRKLSHKGKHRDVCDVALVPPSQRCVSKALFHVPQGLFRLLTIVLCRGFWESVCIFIAIQPRFQFAITALDPIGCAHASLEPN